MVLLNSCSLILETCNSTSKDVKKDIIYFFCTFIDHLLTGPQMPHGSSNCYRAVAETHWFIPVTDTGNLSGVHKIKWISPWDNEKTVRQRDMSNVKTEAWDLTCGLFTLHSQSQCCHLPYMIKKMRFASNTTDTTRSYLQKNIQQILSNINNLQFFFNAFNKSEMLLWRPKTEKKDDWNYL